MTEAGATIESGNIRKPSSESELISSDILTVEELTVEVADIIKEEISSDRLSMHTEKQEDEETGPMLSSADPDKLTEPSLYPETSFSNSLDDKPILTALDMEATWSDADLEIIPRVSC